MREPIAIDDPTDPRLAPYAAIRERDLVGRHGRFIVEGEVTLGVMLSERSRFRTESILLSPERWPAIASKTRDMPDAPPIYLASKPAMSAVSGFPIHRGVLAVGLRGPEPDADTLVPPCLQAASIVALVGLTNHDNVGGLFRSAAAFGADAVLLDHATCDPLYRKAIRVSAGGALTVPFAPLAANDLPDFAERHALVPLALTPGADATMRDVRLPRRALIMLGTEGRGLPEALLTRAQGLRIDMVAGIDSLNVAVAGSIVLHHLRCARAGASRDNPLQLPQA